MDKYYCKCCNYITIRKNDFNKHLNTKKHQNNYKNYVDSDFVTEKKDSKRTQKGLCEKKKDSKRTQKGLSESFFCKNSQKLAKNSQKLAENSHSQNFECEFCGIFLKTRQILLRHMKKYCKVKKQIEKLDEKTSDLIEEQNKLIKYQNEKIDDLLKKKYTINNNTQNNTISHNTINNTININNYGDENLEMLTDEFKKQCVIKPYYALVRIIEEIHFNDKYPENKNIRLVNKRDNKIQVLNDGKWNYRDKEEAIKYALDDSNEKLDKFCEDKQYKFRNIIKMSCKNIVKSVQECNPDILKDLYREMDLVLFNN